MSNEENLKELKATAYWLAVYRLQTQYEISSDFDRYDSNQHDLIKDCVRYLLSRQPTSQDNSITDTDENEDEKKNMITSIYEKIVEHGVQQNENSDVLCSTMFFCIFDENELLQQDAQKINDLIYTLFVFKVQKNSKENDSEPAVLQNWYIDTAARVYKGWDDFLENNNLPACTMIAPKNGKYQADLKELWSEESSSILVEIHKNKANRYIADYIDLATTGLGVGSAIIGAAGLVLPVTAPIAIFARAGGIIAGLWQSGRSTGILCDRVKHEQSITDKNSVHAWINLAGSLTGAASSSGTACLSKAIRTGTSISNGMKIAHDSLIISNLLVNTAGIGFNAYGFYEKYEKKEEISSVDVISFTLHVLFTCNIAFNMKFASEIIKLDQKLYLQEYEKSLRSNRHRKEFRRLVRNTNKHIPDKVQSNEQIIRSITQIDDKSKFFATMARNKKLFASMKVKPSFADGMVSIDGVSLITPSSFASMSKKDILKLLTESINVDLSNIHHSENAKLISISNMKIFINFIETYHNQVMGNGSLSYADASTYWYIMKNILIFFHGKDYSEKLNIIKLIFERTSRLLGIVNEFSKELDLSKCLAISWCVVKWLVPSLESDKIDETLKKFISEVETNLSTFIEIYDCLFSDSAKLGEDELKKIVLAFQEICNKFLLDSAKLNEAKSNVAELIRCLCYFFENSGSKKKIEPDLCSFLQDIFQDDHGISMIHLVDLMSLPEEVVAVMFKEAIISTGSKINEPGDPSQEMIELCQAEIEDFVFRFPLDTNLDINTIQNDLKGIQKDLEVFDGRNIIFYKLIVVAVNTNNNGILTTGCLVEIMKFIWGFINLNFFQAKPNTSMFKKDNEKYIIIILIQIYQSQVKEPEKWSGVVDFISKLSRVK